MSYFNISQIIKIKKVKADFDTHFKHFYFYLFIHELHSFILSKKSFLLATACSHVYNTVLKLAPRQCNNQFYMFSLQTIPDALSSIRYLLIFEYPMQILNSTK